MMEIRAPGSLIILTASCRWALTESRVSKRRSDRFAIRSYSPLATIGGEFLVLQLGSFGQEQFSLARPLNHRWRDARENCSGRGGRAIARAAAEQRPQHPRVVIGERDRSHVGPAPGAKPRRPRRARMRAAAAIAIQQRARAMDQQGAQVAIAMLADPEQDGLAARGVLARSKSQVGAQFAPALELARIADRGDHGAGNQR